MPRERPPFMRPSFLLFASIASLSLPLNAADRFWDINSQLPGAGGPLPDGNWENANWTLSPAGTEPGSFWDPSDSAVFAAGTDATGAYTITLNAVQNASGLTVQEGTVSLAGSGLNIAAATVTIENGAKLSIPSTLNLVATTGAQLNLNGGTFRNTSNAPGAAFADPDFTINIGAAGGTIEVTNTGASSTIFLGTLKGDGNTLIKTGPGEFRFQGPAMADSTFSKLVVNQGLYRLGFVSGNTFETGFGAVPANFTPDAITLSGGGAIGTSWLAADSVLHANRGITLGAGGGALLGNLTVPGAITGTGTLTTSTTIVLTGTNSFTGATVVSSGSLALGTDSVSSGTLLHSAGITVNNGTLSLVNATGNEDRIANTAPVILNNAQLSLTPNAAADTTETVGALSLTFGNNILSVGSVTGWVTTLGAASFSRGSNNATALLRGTGLAQDLPDSIARITLGDAGMALTMVGTATLNNSAPDDATPALKIVPYLFGDNTVGGSGSGFVTYDTTLGFRVLNAAQTISLSAGYSTAANPDNAAAESNIVFGNGSAIVLNSLLFKTASSALTSSTPVPLTVNSGAIGTAGAFNYTIASGFSGLILGNGEGVITVSANTLDINTPISVTGNGGLTKSGAGTLALSTANPYSGGTRINAGIIQANHAQAFGTGPVAIHGTRLAIQGGLTISNPLFIGSNSGVAGRGLIEPVGGIATVSGPISITSNAFAGGHFAAPVGTALIVTGLISAPPAVTVSTRFGNVTMSGGGTGYSALQIQAGTVTIGAENGIATTAIVDLASSDPATLDLNGFNQTVAGLARTSGTIGRDATVTNSGEAKTLTLNVTTSAAYAGSIQAANTAGNATITGNLSLVKNGPGTQSLSGGGANTYTGSTVINGGILKLQKGANTDALPPGNSVTINSGATLQLAQSSLINDELTAFTINGGTFDLTSFLEGVTPVITLTNATIRGSNVGYVLSRGGFDATGINTISKPVGVRGEDANSGRFTIASGVTTVSGNIVTDNGSVQGISKTGAGTLILAGASSYRGATVLKEGTTIVSGSIAGVSVITVGDFANLGTPVVLGGSGSIGPVNAIGSGNAATSGATVSPGNAPNVAGILTTRAFSLTAGAHLAMEIGGAGEAAYDRVAASGVVTLEGGDLKLTLLGTPSFAFGDTLFLIANNSHAAVNGTFATLNGSEFTASDILLNGYRFQLSYTANFTGTNSDGLANDVALIAVPEPGAWLAMLAGLGVLAIRTRSRLL
ncbi:MAG: putative autotransporter protein [Chthoniobacteraceae bacterium]|nr:putative autotransporter protein [Chthoniobacteraceae bacterium]